MSAFGSTGISNYFIKQSDYHCYNTRNKDFLTPPRVKRNLGENTFRFSGGKRFNDLSLELRMTASSKVLSNLTKQSFM